MDPVGMCRHPALLLGRAQADPQQIGRSRVDPLDHRLVLIRGEGSKGRRLHADDLECREPRLKALGQALRDAVLAAIEVARPAQRSGAFAYGEHQVRAVDA
jgi:hypothetical protein